MTDPILKKRIYLRATPATVWSYLTQPEKLGIWFHAPKAPLQEGKPFEMCGNDDGSPLIWGDVHEARAPDYLEYSFTIKPMGDATSTVIWRLTAIEGGTQLDLEHHGFPAGAAAFDLALALDKGWEEHMARLRADIHD